MNYITIIAPTYEEAVRKARDQYGEKLRVHSRKDVVVKGFLGLGKKRHCELTCFLAEDNSNAQKQMQEKISASEKASVEKKITAEDEADIKRFEQEAKTPDPVSGKYRDSEVGEQADGKVQKDVEPEVRPSEESSKAEEASEAEPELAGEEETSEKVEPAVEKFEDEREKKSRDALEALLTHAANLLYENDFSSDYIKWIMADLRAQLELAFPAVPTQEEFELLVVDRIVGSVDIDHNSQLHPPRIFVLLGPTGVGKTTTIAKIAAIYGTVPPVEIRKKVSIITMDSFRVGAYEQIESFGQALNIPVYRADDEAGFYQALENTQDSELVLVDTIGRSPRDNELNVKLRTMLNVPDKKNLKCYLTVSASMKKVDLDKVYEQFRGFGICSVIVTKADETSTIGNILSLCHSKDLPLLFVADGQMVPRDIHKASSAFMLSLLRGFNLDFNSLWNTQIGSDE